MYNNNNMNTNDSAINNDNNNSLGEKVVQMVTRYQQRMGITREHLTQSQERESTEQARMTEGTNGTKGEKEKSVSKVGGMIHMETWTDRSQARIWYRMPQACPGGILRKTRPMGVIPTPPTQPNQHNPPIR